VPADSPVTIPVEPTRAVDELLLHQVPPVVVSMSEVVVFEHSKEEPMKLAGVGSTLIL
jgi:hypothetical protein